MNKRFRIARFFFCRLLLTEMSCRSSDQRRNADTTTESDSAFTSSNREPSASSQSRAAALDSSFRDPVFFCRTLRRRKTAEWISQIRSAQSGSCSGGG
jgi:hypothetical protein